MRTLATKPKETTVGFSVLNGLKLVPLWYGLWGLISREQLLPIRGNSNSWITLQNLKSVVTIWNDPCRANESHAAEGDQAEDRKLSHFWVLQLPQKLFSKRLRAEAPSRRYCVKQLSYLRIKIKSGGVIKISLCHVEFTQKLVIFLLGTGSSCTEANTSS